MGTPKEVGTMQYTFRIPIELKSELERIAEEEDRSLSKQIIYVLRGYLKDRAIKK